MYYSNNGKLLPTVLITAAMGTGIYYLGRKISSTLEQKVRKQPNAFKTIKEPLHPGESKKTWLPDDWTM